MRAVYLDPPRSVMSAAMSARRYAYLHGFGSGPESKKGRALAAAFEAAGKHLDRLDLNRPSFRELTITAALAAIDAWADGPAPSEAATPHAPGGSVMLVGSSLGGYLAALWASLHPERVERLVLFCPGLDMPRRWPELLGAQAMARWQADGVLALPDARGVPTPVHWGFNVDASTHAPAPRPTCPTLVLHGVGDRIVPIASSRAWVATLPDARLVELDDGHELTASLPRLEAETLAFFDRA